MNKEIIGRSCLLFYPFEIMVVDGTVTYHSEKNITKMEGINYISLKYA